ncbi:MAG: hypothetical protein KC613_26225, partial [Myxococcales bacterium]|nr:hypothetical protein [Myxococcales bacterium]
DVAVVDLNAWVAANGAFEDTLEGRMDHLSAVCGGGAGGEFVFRYVVDRALDRLTFSTRNPGTVAPVVMYLRDTCLGPDLQCDRGPAEDPGVAFTLERPAPGTYYLVVDTGSRMAVGPFRLEVDAVAPPACRDGLDNDGDGALDLADPGCEGTEDADEADPAEPPVCANGLDDDADGLTDYPADPDCAAAGYGEEQPPCGLGSPIARLGQQGGELQLAPVQGGGFAQPSCEPGLGAETVIVLTLTEPSDVSFQVLDQAGTPVAAGLHARGGDCVLAANEVGCRRAAQSATPLELVELDRGTWFLFAEQGVVAPAQPLTARVVVTSAVTECNDQVDNDGDGRVDLADPGCERGRDGSEADPAEPPVCANGLDDDGDGLTDYPDDPDCDAAGDPDEDVDCQGDFFGDVCVVWLSDACVGGSATQLCADRGAEVITEAEFRAVIAAGWMRPDANYHTMTVAQYSGCAGDIGNMGIPGWGDRHWNCGDVQDYCNRSVMCVTR